MDFLSNEKTTETTKNTEIQHTKNTKSNLFPYIIFKLILRRILFDPDKAKTLRTLCLLFFVPFVVSAVIVCAGILNFEKDIPVTAL